MVDASSSVGANLPSVLNFVISIVDSFATGIGMRYGMVTFGAHAQV